MAHPARSPDVMGGEGRPEDGEISLVDGDYKLCAKLQAYLACCLRNADPPRPLAEAWDHFYAANAPRIKAFLKRRGVPPADFEALVFEQRTPAAEFARKAGTGINLAQGTLAFGKGTLIGRE